MPLHLSLIDDFYSYFLELFTDGASRVHFPEISFTKQFLFGIELFYPSISSSFIKLLDPLISLFLALHIEDSFKRVAKLHLYLPMRTSVNLNSLGLMP